jgi:hypothetical protein
MKTIIKKLSLSDFAGECSLTDLDRVTESDTKIVSAWNGLYMETIFVLNGLTFKLTTRITSFGKTISSEAYTLHPIYVDFERFYMGDELTNETKEHFYDEQSMIAFHAKKFNQLITKYGNRR